MLPIPRNMHQNFTIHPSIGFSISHQWLNSRSCYCSMLAKRSWCWCSSNHFCYKL